MARTKRPTTYQFAVRTDDIRNVASLIEMLRYDAATVKLRTADHVIFETIGHVPEGARWESFRMPIQVCRADANPHAVLADAREFQEVSKS